ncbi:MAG: tyrosine-type recombinase/integrase [Actinobacteria bacterium]|nr:tyrosine-type recombinase/integrase [Actinomycetota bacterium]
MRAVKVAAWWRRSWLCRHRHNHDLRHTSVALAIAEGAHPKAIQARMGHSSINVTLDRYGHLLPELDEGIAIRFGERLADARRSQRERSGVLHAALGDSAAGQGRWRRAGP